MGETREYEYGRTLDALVARASLIWVLALLFYGAGDLVTTLVGFQFPGVAEVGVLAAALTPHGAAGFIALKAASFALFGVFWVLIPDPYRIGVPLGLAALGAVVTVWNTVVLLVHVL